MMFMFVIMKFPFESNVVVVIECWRSGAMIMAMPPDLVEAPFYMVFNGSSNHSFPTVCDSWMSVICV